MSKTDSKPIKTVILMMAATVISKGLGMLRGMLIGWHYGIGEQANVFSMASHIPSTFFDLLFSAAIIGCFIPVYNSFKADEEKQADEFASVFVNVIILLTGLLTIIGMVFAPGIVDLMASEFTPEMKQLTVKLLRIMFPMIIFTGSTYTLIGVLQSKGKYILPAFISAVSNAGVIFYLIVFDNLLGENGIYGLAFAQLTAWFLQLLTIIIPLIKNKFNYKLIIDLKNSAFIRAIKMLPSIILGSCLISFLLLSGLFFSAYAGNVTVFDNAYYVFTVIAGILTHSICNYIFPILSRLSVHGDINDFVDTVRTGLLSSFMIMIPFTFAVYALSGEGISIIYLGRQYTAEAANMTADTLRWILPAMPAFAVIEILSRVFYSHNLYKIPMIASAVGMAVNIISSILLLNIKDMGVGAVGCAMAVSLISAALTLLIFLFAKIRNVYNKLFFVNVIKITVSGILSFLVMILIGRVIGNDPYTATRLKNIISALGIFIPGAVVYCAGLMISRVKIKHKA